MLASTKDGLSVTNVSLISCKDEIQPARIYLIFIDLIK
jgi:hypothetical protein